MRKQECRGCPRFPDNGLPGKQDCRLSDFQTEVLPRIVIADPLNDPPKLLFRRYVLAALRRRTEIAAENAAVEFMARIT